jgi:AcrR family transcriptional regulator
MQTERQKEIIDAALLLIHEKGIQGLTIKNLSKKIGITEPAIYRHFENKIQILTTILDTLKTNTDKLFKTEPDSNNTSIEKIEQLFTKHFVSFSNNPSLVSVVFSEELFKSEPVLIEKISEVIENNHNTLTSIIIEGQNKGEIRNDAEAVYLTIIIMGTLRLFVKKWQFSGFSYNLTSEGKKIINTIKALITK